MKLYAPKYYKDFKCIADKCTHSCCIGWEIDVDKATFKKYSHLKNSYGNEIKKSIEKVPVPHFKLQDNDRCPHLDENGLCKIIINCGEEYLCQICREHPRFYNYTNYGKEVGLGLSCPEACRIILSSDNYDEITEIAEVSGETEKIDFDATKCRKDIYSILKNKALSYNERLKLIYKSYNASLSILPDSKFVKRLEKLEYLDNSHKELFLNYSSCLDTEAELDKVLAYLIYRHCTEAMDENEHRISLIFCLLCERLLASMIKNNKDTDIITLATILSEEIEYSEENTEAIRSLIEEAI